MTSEISIKVELDEKRMPVSIRWSSSDEHKNGESETCKAMSIALFSEEHLDTLRIDLWTKDLQLIEMDRFMFQILRSLSDTYLRATTNKDLAEEMARFAHYFGEKTQIIPPSE